MVSAKFLKLNMRMGDEMHVLKDGILSGPKAKGLRL
jgi:hypothetical protein